MLSKSLSTSRKFRALLDKAGKRREFDQVLYTLLVSHADDFGRLAGDPFTVKALCYPTSPRAENDFAGALGAMHEVGLIVLYEAEGDTYVQIVAFDEHQSGLHKRTKSRFPDPPGSSRKFQETPTQGKGTEGKGTELNRTEGGGPPTDAHEIPEEFSSAIRDTNLEPLLNGAATPRFWSKLSKMDREYPWLHVSEELRSLADWLESNPDKPRKNLAKYVTTNLRKAIKRGLEQGKPEARRFANEA